MDLGQTFAVLRRHIETSMQKARRDAIRITDAAERAGLRHPHESRADFKIRLDREIERRRVEIFGS